MVTTYACYARNDTTHPLRGMLIQATVCAAGIAVVVSLQAHGAALLTGLGLSLCRRQPVRGRVPAPAPAPRAAGRQGASRRGPLRPARWRRRS